MYYRGPGFLAVVRFGSVPTSSPSPVSKSTADTQEDFERETTCGRESGREGWGRSQIIRRRESLVLYNRLNALWCHPPYSEFLTPPNNYTQKAGDVLTRKTGIGHPWTPLPFSHSTHLSCLSYKIIEVKKFKGIVSQKYYHTFLFQMNTSLLSIMKILKKKKFNGTV